MKKTNNLFKKHSGKFYVFALILMLAANIYISEAVVLANGYDDEYDEPEIPDPVVFMDAQGLTYDNISYEEGDNIEVDVVWGDQDKVSGKIVVPVTIKDPNTGKSYKVVSATGIFNLCTRISSVVLPKTWNEISFKSFYGCTSLKSVTLKASSVKLIDSAAFWGCHKLTTIKNIQKVKEIGYMAFRDCFSLKKLKLDQVVSIDDNAFQGCKKLKTITIGKKFKELGSFVFSRCKKLKTITIKSTKLKKVSKTAFKNTSQKITIKVPKKKLSAYKKLFKNKGNKKVVVKAA